MNVEIIDGKKKSSANRRAGRQTQMFHGKSCGISEGVG
jgi:hypothetical protein